MNFFGWRKNLSISELDPTFKVRYLGNVQTAVMKGDGCVDRAASIIWSNYQRSEHQTLEMKVVLTGSGMKAYTKEQGLTEYRAHRISYCIAHPSYPRLFVWVYRHEGRKMKMELRCHALLCKSAAKAKAMALQLHEKLSFALREFQREKLRKQTSRLTLQRVKTSTKIGHVLPLRTQLLSTANNFKPPVAQSHSAPKLGSITEDEEENEWAEEDTDTEDLVLVTARLKRGSVGARLEGNSNSSLPATPVSTGPSAPGLRHDGLEHHDIVQALDLEAADGLNVEFFNSEPIIDLEIGNDLDELRRDKAVLYCLHENADSDEESAESGFHEQEQDFIYIEKDKVTRKGSLSEGKCETPTICHIPSYWREEDILISDFAEKTPL